MAVTGVPILPPTCTAIPDSRRMWPVSAVVVVFPLEPVMPMMRPLQERRRQFHFADHRDAAPARAASKAGEIRRHARRKHDQIRRRRNDS